MLFNFRKAKCPACLQRVLPDDYATPGGSFDCTHCGQRLRLAEQNNTVVVVLVVAAIALTFIMKPTTVFGFMFTSFAILVAVFGWRALMVPPTVELEVPEEFHRRLQ